MAVSGELVIHDYSAEVLEALGEQVEIGLQAIGMEAEGYAKDETPVDSGRLRNSIAWATENAEGNADVPMQEGDSTPKGRPEPNSVHIGSNVEYAVYVEYGDYAHKVGKKHFLRDAMTNHGDHYREILKAALED